MRNNPMLEAKIMKAMGIGYPAPETPSRVRLPIFGEGPIGREIRDLLDDTSFGEFFCTREPRLKTELPGGKIIDYILGALGDFIDREQDPYRVSIHDVWVHFAQLGLLNGKGAPIACPLEVGAGDCDECSAQCPDEDGVDANDAFEVFDDMRSMFLAQHLRMKHRRLFGARDLEHACTPEAIAAHYLWSDSDGRCRAGLVPPRRKRNKTKG